MAPTEVTKLSIAHGGGACATPAYRTTSADTGNKRLSFGSITVGLWELGSGDAAEGGSTASTLPHQKALPPLPAVPPVGPGGPRRPRTKSLTRSQSLKSKAPTPSNIHRVTAERGGLSRSHSMADLFSSMVAARLKPVALFTRSTHCQECNQRFSLIFRRHHCRMCERSVCAYCSTYQRMPSDMEEQNEPDTDHSTHTTDDESWTNEGGGRGEEGRGGGMRGELSEEDESLRYRAAPSTERSSSQPTVLHRVCRKCAGELEGRESVINRSWTHEFCSLRQFFKQGRHTGVVTDNIHLLPPKIPRLPPVCERVARTFLEECKKHAARNKSLFRTTSESFNAGLQYALKPPGQKLCKACSKVLRFSVERKTCALCDEVFCRNCSSRDLALTMPDDLHPGDTGHEMTQVNVMVLSKEEAEELDKSNNNNGAAGNPNVAMQRYRVCDGCREHVSHVMQVMAFNDTLTQIQAELFDLQEQITAVLDEQDIPSPGIGLSRWPSVRSVTSYTNAEDEVIGEAVNERVASKLLERFFRVYLNLESLKPVNVTQKLLYKHVKQAMSSFYMSRRSQSSKRFSRRDTIAIFPNFPM
ncbi:uncharacterized protein [Littorina saxatilis]|uniref:uncharacterized protein n=1 Tax=Littorina saxatilis TaxID=31220 RepID=UPI0038B6797F